MGKSKTGIPTHLSSSNIKTWHYYTAWLKIICRQIQLNLIESSVGGEERTHHLSNNIKTFYRMGKILVFSVKSK